MDRSGRYTYIRRQGQGQHHHSNQSATSLSSSSSSSISSTSNNNHNHYDSHHQSHNQQMLSQQHHRNTSSHYSPSTTSAYNTSSQSSMSREPLTQHDELIRYIREAWTKVSEQGTHYYHCNESDNQLKNFKPFNLEEYWGQRLVQNIHVSHGHQ